MGGRGRGALVMKGQEEERRRGKWQRLTIPHAAHARPAPCVCFSFGVPAGGA